MSTNRPDLDEFSANVMKALEATRRTEPRRIPWLLVVSAIGYTVLVVCSVLLAVR